MSWLPIRWTRYDYSLSVQWKSDAEGRDIPFIDERNDFDVDELRKLFPSLFGRMPKTREPFTKKERYNILKQLGRLCIDCGTNEDIQIHHIDGNPSNNTLNNLEPMCYRCHRKTYTNVEREGFRK